MKQAPLLRALRAGACALAALALLACSKTTAEPTAVVVEPIPGTAATPAGLAASASVPDAASVLGTTSATKVDPVAGRENRTMSRAEESTAMPMPGQNNDHSAPLPPAKSASRP